MLEDWVDEPIGGEVGFAAVGTVDPAEGALVGTLAPSEGATELPAWTSNGTTVSSVI